MQFSLAVLSIVELGVLVHRSAQWYSVPVMSGWASMNMPNIIQSLLTELCWRLHSNGHSHASVSLVVVGGKGSLAYQHWGGQGNGHSGHSGHWNAEFRLNTHFSYKGLPLLRISWSRLLICCEGCYQLPDGTAELEYLSLIKWWWHWITESQAKTFITPRLVHPHYVTILLAPIIIGGEMTNSANLISRSQPISLRKFRPICGGWTSRILAFWMYGMVLVHEDYIGLFAKSIWLRRWSSSLFPKRNVCQYRSDENFPC